MGTTDGSTGRGIARSQLLLTLCCVGAILVAAHLLAGVGPAPLGGIGGEEGNDEWLIEVDGGAGSSLDGEGAPGDGGGPLSLHEETEVGQEDDAFSDETNEFREQDERHLFTVESDRPSYWRIGSYETYTGTGWSDDRSYRPSDGAFEYETEQLAGETITHTITVVEPRAILPVAWRPEAIDVGGDVEVRSDGAVRADSPLEGGDSYTVESVAPPTDPDVLREAGTSYPAEIEDRYTQLPSNEPDRVGEFTSELTEGDETPYDKAVTIESWLRSEKDYDLEATHDPSETVADQLIFEMDEAYCEYFATAMVSMLRNEGVPARYVVGYATGIETGDGVYEVSGTHAHAWVEVYFPGVGWVPFEPTPPDDRQAGEEAAFSEAHDDVDPDDLDLDHGEPELPTDDEYDDFDEDLVDRVESDGDDEFDDDGELDDTGELDEDDSVDAVDDDDADDESEDKQADDADEEVDDAEDEDDEQVTATDLDVELNRTPTPGITVEAVVTHDDEPVPGVDVTFNGEPVGTTDGAGSVVGQVPFSSELVVGLRYDGESTTEQPSNSVGFGPPSIGDRFFHPGDVTPPIPDAVWSGTERMDGEELLDGDDEVTAEEANRTFSVEGDLNVAVEGVFAPGGEIAIESTIDDRPVPEATVERNGTELGTTDESGQLEATLPEEVGTQTIVVSRGDLEAETEIEVVEPALSIDHRFGYPIAGTEMTITFEWGDETVADAPIERNGVQIGETNENGTLTTTAPFSQTTSLDATRPPLEATTTVENALRNAIVLLLSTVGLVLLGSVVVYRRYGLTPKRVWSRIYAGVRAISRGMTNGLIAVAGWLEKRLGWEGEMIRTAVMWLTAFPVELYRNGIGVLVTLDPRRLVRWIRRWIRRKRQTLRRGVEGLRPRREPRNGDDGGRTEPVDERTITVRSLWREFLSLVSPPGVRTKTPAEIATYATDRGFPADPVTTITDAFRDVEYGSKSVSDERLSLVQTAWRAILAEDDDRGVNSLQYGSEGDGHPDTTNSPEPTESDHRRDDGDRFDSDPDNDAVDDTRSANDAVDDARSANDAVDDARSRSVSRVSTVESDDDRTRGDRR